MLEAVQQLMAGPDPSPSRDTSTRHCGIGYRVDLDRS
jgi:hypothetical protein